MQRKLMPFLCLLFLYSTSSLYSQLAGDYRSNITGVTGSWTTASNWQVYDGAAWQIATVAPNASNGTITIMSGDSVRLSSAVTIDQVKIESGGSLAIFGTTVTLNNSPGVHALEINGLLNLTNSGTLLTGAGTVSVEAGGLMVFKTAAALAANLTVQANGMVRIEGNPKLQSSFTNNGTILLVKDNIAFENGTLINNSLLNITAATATAFTGTINGNLMQNNATGVINKTATGTHSFNVPVINLGTISGIGIYTVNASFNNTGIISPGSSPGFLWISAAAVSGNTTNIVIEIADGSGAGTGNDLLDILSTVDISQATLTITDNNTAPTGVYTIVQTNTGNFIGSFKNVVKPSNFAAPVVSGNKVTIEKLHVLPVVWGAFTVQTKSNAALLNWVTLKESGSSHFVIEHSTNGTQFQAVGTVKAKGDAAYATEYSFTHQPGGAANHYYRLKQIDIDGRTDYSVVKKVMMSANHSVLLTAAPNPVKDQLRLQVYGNDVQVKLYLLNGTPVTQWQLQSGTYVKDISHLASGMYQLLVFKKGVYTNTISVIKQ